jgi:hypothetical protein
MALVGGPQQSYQAYNEEAFRHFLSVERRRAERSGRSLLLLLVEIDANHVGDARMQSTVARRVLTTLQGCVREVDFIGWYRAGRVIGAVLTQGPDVPTSETSRQIGERVAEALGDQISGKLKRSIQVRVLQLRPTLKR